MNFVCVCRRPSLIRDDSCLCLFLRQRSTKLLWLVLLCLSSLEISLDPKYISYQRWQTMANPAAGLQLCLVNQWQRKRVDYTMMARQNSNLIRIYYLVVNNYHAKFLRVSDCYNWQWHFIINSKRTALLLYLYFYIFWMFKKNKWIASVNKFSASYWSSFLANKCRSEILFLL